MADIKKTFGQYVFETLKEDEELGDLVGQFIPFSEYAKKKAEISSTVGELVSAAIGVGWTSEAMSGIIFKNSPVSFGSILESGKIIFHLSTNYPRATFKGLWIETKTKGLIHKEITEVRLRFYDKDPTRRRIETDQDLLDQLLRLFKTGKFQDISEYTQAKINIKIENGIHAQIEAKIVTDIQPDTLKDFLKCFFKIANYVNIGPAMGIRKRKFWTGSTGKEYQTTVFNIPDSSNAPWDIDRTWWLSWKPYETKTWQDKWCNTAKCEIAICDALTNKHLKQITLGCQRPHDGFTVDELENTSERLQIWGKLYLLVKVTGYDGQWHLGAGFFEGSMAPGSAQEGELFLNATEEGRFEQQ